MDLTYGLYLYFGVVVIVTLLLCRWGIAPWSALVIAMVGGQVLLLYMVSPSEVDMEAGSGYATYLLINLLTVVGVFVYALVVAFHDRSERKII